MTDFVGQEVEVTAGKYKYTPIGWRGHVIAQTDLDVIVQGGECEFYSIPIRHIKLCEQRSYKNAVLVEEKKPLEWKVGARVMSTSSRGVGRKLIKNAKGTIVNIVADVYCIDFDEDIDGHSCEGFAREGHGWISIKQDLKLI